MKPRNVGQKAGSGTPGAIAPGIPLRVMTWNIRHGRGNDDRVDLDRIARVIVESGATLIGLQEMDRGGARSGRIDQAASLARTLGMEARFVANATFDPGDDRFEPHHYDVAILSAHPIVATEHRRLTNDFGWEQRGALAVTVDVGDGCRFTVVNTHLQWAGDDNEIACSRQRAQQVAEVLALARDRGGAAIVMGDFNAGPGSPELAAIDDPSSGFADAWRIANPTAAGHTIPTSPTGEAGSRIDYLLTSDGLRVDAAEVDDTPTTRMASDHFPVWADVVLIDRPEVRPPAR